MSERRDDDFGALSAGYALDAISEADRRLLENAVAESPEARNEVAGMVETASVLALAVDPVAPPSSLRSRILADIAKTPQLPAPDDTAIAGPADARVIEAPEARIAWFRRPVALLATAAAAAALVIGGVAGVDTIAEWRGERVQASLIEEVYAAGDFSRAATPVDGGGEAVLVWSFDLERAALTFSGVSELSDDQAYQLWFINESGAASAGTFTVDSSSATSVVLDGALSRGDAIGVTVEPAGGSEQPTTEPVVVFSTV